MSLQGHAALSLKGDQARFPATGKKVNVTSVFKEKVQGTTLQSASVGSWKPVEQTSLETICKHLRDKNVTRSTERAY